MDEAQPSGKILRGAEGLGTVSLQMIEGRAREIARSDVDARSQTISTGLVRARTSSVLQ